MYPHKKKSVFSDLQILHTDKYFSVFTFTSYDRVATPYALAVGSDKINSFKKKNVLLSSLLS